MMKCDNGLGTTLAHIINHVVADNGVYFPHSPNPPALHAHETSARCQQLKTKLLAEAQCCTGHHGLHMRQSVSPALAAGGSGSR